MKRCCKCGSLKDLDSFHRHRGRKDGRHTVCKECRVGSDTFNTRAAHLKRKFGITMEQYEAMLERQGGVCAICERPERVRGRGGAVMPLAVDHSHNTGEVRGLLCKLCNTAIGKLDDSPTLLRRAAEYVSK